MGWLTYGSAPPIEIEDRLLHHLQAVIITKLRRDEPFAFNWEQSRQRADGEAGARSHGRSGSPARPSSTSITTVRVEASRSIGTGSSS